MLRVSAVAGVVAALEDFTLAGVLGLPGVLPFDGVLADALVFLGVFAFAEVRISVETSFWNSEMPSCENVSPSFPSESRAMGRFWLSISESSRHRKRIDAL
jgi:hypothetical protein